MPTLIHKALRWAGGGEVAKASRGTLSDYIQGINPSYGQPIRTTADSDGVITPERMREVVMKTPTAGAAMNAILDYAGGVNIKLRNIDAAKPVPYHQRKKVQRLINRPNPTQTQRQFLLSLYKDIFTFGFGAVELEMDQTGQDVVGMWVLDSARLRIDFDEHGMVRGYDMLNANGMPISNAGVDSRWDSPPPRVTYMGRDSTVGKGVHAWEPHEVLFFSLNPTSNSVYPYSRVRQLFTLAVVEDLMVHFIATRFTDSNVPFGVMDLGDVTEQELNLAISNWNTQAQEQHRILLTGSKGGSRWIPFGYHLKDLEATGLLAEVRGKIMALLGVTMNELGESQDINKSNGYNLSFTFKKRAIEPLLNETVQTFTRGLLWDMLAFDDLEFYYEEIDSRDELLQAQIDDVYLKAGVVTINQIRNRRGDTDVPGGDTSYVFTGGSWIPVDMLTQAAQNMMALEMASGGSFTGADSSTNVRTKVQGRQSQQGRKPDGVAHAQRDVSGQNKEGVGSG